MKSSKPSRLRSIYSVAGMLFEEGIKLRQDNKFSMSPEWRDSEVYSQSVLKKLYPHLQKEGDKKQ